MVGFGWTLRFGWFPAFGGEGPLSLVLPLIALAIPVSGPIAQLLVRSFSTEFGSGYVTTSWAKGATKLSIIIGDVFRNEALHAVGVDPRRSCRSLDDAEHAL